MPQLYFSVDEASAEEITLRARQAGQTVSRFVADLVLRELGHAWPAGYLESVVGSCSAHPLEEPGDPPPRAVDL